MWEILQGDRLIAAAVHQTEAATRVGEHCPCSCVGNPLGKMRAHNEGATGTGDTLLTCRPCVWAALIDSDHTLLLVQLEGRLLNGLQQLSGGKALADAFGAFGYG